MLRVHQQVSAEATRSYYSAGDYYASEAEGQWFGKGAERLGLNGTVEPASFEALCSNRDPTTGERLTALNAADRTVCYDFNFHPPKSLSTLYGLFGDERLREALEASVLDTLRSVEAEMKTRVRKGGRDEERITGNIAGSLFTHTTSRPLADGIPDPHLHCHAILFNATHDLIEDCWKAGQFRDLKRDAPYYEAIFHSHLAKRVADLGYGIERNRKGWEIAGVAPGILKSFSRRTEQIEEIAARKGIVDPEQKAALGAKSRRNKNANLTPEELRREWRGRIADGDIEALAKLGERMGQGIESGTDRSVADAFRFAAEHCFANDSVVREKQFLEAALRRGLGETGPDAVLAKAGDGLIRASIDGQVLVTTPAVLAEEQRMVGFARQGRGACAPLGGPTEHFFRRDFLNEDQRSAVRHLLESPDRVMLVQGKAGVGKSTLLKEAVEAIEERGRKVFVFAPTAQASRGVLREEGFASATTVAELVQDVRLHGAIEGQVVLIDEAGLVGTRTMAKVFDLADKANARVILVGDTSQHRSVERGAALRMLEEQAGCAPAEVRSILRQQGAYKEAVKSLSEGNTLEGFDQLDRLGWVSEIADAAERDQQMTRDYIDLVGQGKKTLIVAPTHREGERITAAVRLGMQQQGSIKMEEVAICKLTPLHLTEAERGDFTSFSAGDVVQFIQNAKGVRRGERCTVESASGEGGVVVRDGQGRQRDLPLAEAKRFQLYRKETLTVAKGDLLRITQNGTSKDGHALHNGALYRLSEIAGNGDLRLDNGWVLDRAFGHLAHGYVVTSPSSQGRTVDVVLLGQSRASGAAASAEQFYVGSSRARQGVRVYVDDKPGVREGIGRSTRTMSASELAQRSKVQPQRLPRFHRIRRRMWDRAVRMFDRLREPFIDNRIAAPAMAAQERAHER